LSKDTESKIKITTFIELGLLLGTAAILAIVVSNGLTFFLQGSSHPTVGVTTGSMLPIYNGFQDSEYQPIYPFRGDVLLVRKVPAEAIEVGDVIIFDTPSVSDPVVHRVIDKWFDNGTYFFKTNGDNNLPPDDWSVKDTVDDEDDDIIGVVVFRIPHIGWFWLVIQTVAGRLIVLTFALLILFIGDNEDSAREAANKSKNRRLGKKHPLNESSIEGFKIKDKLKKITRKRSFIYPITFLSLGLIFLSTNLIAAFISHPSVTLYSLNNQHLLDSTEENPYSLSQPSDSRYDWIKGTQGVHFFPIRLEVRSGGMFNNIDKIEIYAQVKDTTGFYRWNIIYNYIGSRVLEGGIIVLLDGDGTYNATITVIFSSRGLLASSTSSFTFPLKLINS
jgi:signal peptidase I